MSDDELNELIEGLDRCDGYGFWPGSGLRIHEKAALVLREQADEIARLRKLEEATPVAAITISGPTGCGKSAVMEILYRALRAAGLHPYSDDLAHERRQVDEQPAPSTKVWHLREVNCVAPYAAQQRSQEPVWFPQRDMRGLIQAAPPAQDAEIAALRELEADAERYRHLKSIALPHYAWDRHEGAMWHMSVHDPKDKGLNAAIDTAREGR